MLPYGHLSACGATWWTNFALSVTDLDACVAKLGSDGVRFLGPRRNSAAGRQRIDGLGRPYKLGYTRAVMIEGPNREEIELVKVK